MIGSSSGGEKALSWQSPGGALTAFELGNAPLFGAFPDRARSLPREKEFVDFNRHYRPPAVLSLLYNKRQVWRKLGPAAQKRGFACRRIFKKRAPAKIAQRVLREEEQRASEQSREEHSGLRNLLRCDEAEGNPPRGSIFESKRNVNFLASLFEGGVCAASLRESSPTKPNTV